MILDKESIVNITSVNIKRYKDKGYENAEIGTTINIKIEDLALMSHNKILVKCDICGNEKYLAYQKYNKNITKYNIYTCSTKCSYIKNKETNIKKYGVEHPLKSKEIMDNLKNTVKERYGVDNVFQMESVKEQTKITNLKNLGVEYPQQSKEIMDKSNATNLIKYGVKRPSQNKDVNKKYTESCKKTLIDKFNSDKIRIQITDIDYVNNIIIATCDKGHVFDIHIKTLYGRTSKKFIQCTTCNPILHTTSLAEVELSDFIKENHDGKVITNTKQIISPYELDIYLPELKLAYEFNGLFWHSELNKSDNYHRIKSDMCDKKGIQLIHIWEDDWMDKKEIVKSMILNKLGKTNNKIFARKCEIKEINDNNLVRLFLNENHIQGFVGSSVKIGLFYESNLVSLMTFGMKRKSMNSQSEEDGEYEMLRFCNKLNTNVVGGASKLFKYFLNKYNPLQIITYADRSYSNGNLYKQLGFKLSHLSLPNYYYIIDTKRHYRFGFRKDLLIKEGYDSSKSEHQIMLDRGIYRIFNAGNYVFKLLNNI